jgi:hypothetical protein
LATRTARAETAASESERREIALAVCADASRAATWNEAWTLTYVIAAVGSAGTAALAPAAWLDDDRRASLYVTAAKASIGVLDKIVDPLHVDTDGACDDAAAQTTRSTLAAAARRERRTLATEVVGGLAVNALGLVYLGFGRDAWGTAWTSFAIGVAASAASTLTAPKRSWLLDRRLARGRDVALVPWLGRDRTGVAVVARW